VCVCVQDAFWLLVALLRSPDHFHRCTLSPWAQPQTQWLIRSPYGPRPGYDPSLSGLLVLAHVFGELLQLAEPEVAAHAVSTPRTCVHLRLPAD
jgi:hypothetical protein